jgi:lipopolysaccharide export system permease protein
MFFNFTLIMIRIVKTLDFYILRQLLATVLFSVVGLCVLFVIVHLLENLDSFLDRKTPARVVAVFYLNYLPEIIKLITPVAMLVSSLFTMGRLTQLNELTAMKAGGMSLWRVMTPVLLFGACAAAAQLYFDGWIVPRANRAKFEFERAYLGKGRLETSLYNVYFRDSPTRNLAIRYYDDNTKTGSGLTVEEYTSETSPRLVRRIDANSFAFDSARGAWRLSNGFEHRFAPKDYRAAVSATPLQSLDITLNSTPALLMQFQRNTSEMTFPELKTYIDASERGGKDVRQQRIAYWGEYILPFANFIVMLFGVPFSSGKRKSGLATEIALAMAVTFLYIAAIRVGQSVGLAGGAHPALAAAAPHTLFLCIGVANLLRARS